MKMKDKDEIYENALRVAYLYYYNGLTTELIAKEMNFSRPKVSRLLNFAKESGLVEIKIIDKRTSTNPLEKVLLEKFKALHELHIVSVPTEMDKQETQQRVAQYAASYLNNVLTPNQICGIAWHSIVLEMSKYLTPKKISGIKFIQLHGQYSNNLDNRTWQLLYKFSENYQAKPIIFPVPVFFYSPASKNVLWKESNIQKTIKIQKKANTILFGISNFLSEIKSHPLYSEGYINNQDVMALKKSHVSGEIAATFFDKDGRYSEIDINHRSSGIDLDFFKNVSRSICVMAEKTSAPALSIALRAGYISDLIIDENTASELSRY